MIHIKIPFATPSINHLYYHIRNMKVLTKDARKLIKDINDICRPFLTLAQYHDNKPLHVSIFVHDDWYKWMKKKIEIPSLQYFSPEMACKEF
jgi:hypothetical protein